jgi:hypothetical protein
MRLEFEGASAIHIVATADGYVAGQIEFKPALDSWSLHITRGWPTRARHGLLEVFDRDGDCVGADALTVVRASALFTQRSSS